MNQQPRHRTNADALEMASSYPRSRQRRGHALERAMTSVIAMEHAALGGYTSDATNMTVLARHRALPGAIPKCP